MKIQPSQVYSMPGVQLGMQCGDPLGSLGFTTGFILDFATVATGEHLTIGFPYLRNGCNHADLICWFKISVNV